MLSASYLFYSFFGLQFTAILAALTIAGWGCTQVVGRAQPRGLAAKLASGAGILAHLGVLVWFKLYGFFALSVQAALEAIGLQVAWEITQVAVPVGVSFIVFRGIGALVDVYRNDAEPPSMADYALFMAFFPYLAAGPVVRLSELVPQFTAQSNPARVRSAEGLLLVASGLIKKLLVADYVARVAVDEVFAAPGLYGSADALAAMYGYAVQIYCDFSGYTDMAIGIALLLGISLPQNFDMPYAATSLQQFWRRWHMTLSRFLRDYLYIPLGGNRRGSTRQRFNLMATMLLGGLWHGAGLNFLVWGGMHGLGLVIESAVRARRSGRERRGGVAGAFLGWLLTFNFVVIAWVFFRADSVSNALEVIGRVFTGWSMPATVSPVVWVLILLVVALQFAPSSLRAGGRGAFWSLKPWVQGVLLAGVLFAVAALTPEGPTAFIYAGF